jgi:hypothetical protein
MANTQDANGKDMPMGGIEISDMKKRATETGCGATVQEIECGYRTIANADSDSQIGVLPMPTRSVSVVAGPPPIDPMPRGFLPRLPFPIDR